VKFGCGSGDELEVHKRVASRTGLSGTKNEDGLPIKPETANFDHSTRRFIDVSLGFLLFWGPCI
jgi:hypothetical protein